MGRGEEGRWKGKSRGNRMLREGRWGGGTRGEKMSKAVAVAAHGSVHLPRPTCQCAEAQGPGSWWWVWHSEPSGGIVGMETSWLALYSQLSPRIATQGSHTHSDLQKRSHFPVGRP